MWRELAELVADHLLGDEHRDELAAVVDGEREADHVRDDHRAARVGRDRRACSGSASFCATAIFFVRYLSTNGPFLTERGMAYLFLLAAADDELLGPLVVTGLEALGLARPTACTGGDHRSCGLRRRPSGDRPGSSTTPRLCGRMPSQRLRPALPHWMLRVLAVADRADGRAAVDVDAAHLARGHAQRRPVAFLRHQRDLACRPSGRSARRAPILSSTAWMSVPTGM